MTGELLITKAIQTSKAPQPGLYSQAIRVDCGTHSKLIMSGQTGNIPDGKEEPVFLGGVGPQTTQTLENILAVVQEAGGSIANILKLEIFLRDPAKSFMDALHNGIERKSQRLKFNKAYEDFFKSHGITKTEGILPARVMVWVPEVPLEKPTEETEIEINPVEVIISKS